MFIHIITSTVKNNTFLGDSKALGTLTHETTWKWLHR